METIIYRGVTVEKRTAYNSSFYDKNGKLVCRYEYIVWNPFSFTNDVIAVKQSLDGAKKAINAFKKN